MKIIYYCFGGAHSSVVTAAIHLGLLPSDRVPSRKEILSIERFDRTKPSDIGVPYFMGTDDLGNPVYVLGTGSAKDLCIRVLRDLLIESGVSKDELVMVPTLKYVGVLARIGGYLSRGLGVSCCGRPLVVEGIRRTYTQFVERAQECRERLVARNETH